MDERYWDANVFLGWLREEPDKVEFCRAVLDEAENGRALLVTSALTPAEVIKLRRHEAIPQQDAERIRRFFARSFISVRNVDRYVAEEARELLWAYDSLHPKDAIHIATAVRLQIGVLETFDGDLLKLDERIGTPALRIRRPTVDQPSLPLGPDGTDTDTGPSDAL